MKMTIYMTLFALFLTSSSYADEIKLIQLKNGEKIEVNTAKVNLNSFGEVDSIEPNVFDRVYSDEIEFIQDHSNQIISQPLKLRIGGSGDGSGG